MKCPMFVALLSACTVDIDARVVTSESSLGVSYVSSLDNAGLVDYRDPFVQAPLRARDVVIDDTLQVGAEVPEASTQKVLFSSIDTGTRVMVTIDSDTATNHNSGGGSNQITNLWLKATGGFDTTTQNGVNRALEITAACSVDAGAGSCEDTAIIANAANGYSWRSETGTMRHDGAVQFGTGVSPATVTLGSNVQPFLLQGTAGTATQIHVGWDSTPGNVNNGTSIAVKNNQSGVSVGGMSVALDTSIAGASGVRGGYFMTRGAAGGLGSGLSSGMVIAGGSGFPFVESAANEMSIYDELGQGISFGANTTTYRKAFVLTAKDHLSFVGVAASANASCTSGTGSSFTGTDSAGKIKLGSTSTSCTLTFGNTYTVAPACIITAEGGVTLPTYTISATAITMTTITAAATYNYWCPGLSGGT